MDATSECSTERNEKNIMYITFYAGHKYYGGMNNTGGSLTILKSADILRSIGNKVDVVACNDKCTWYDHPEIKKKISKKTDVAIACSVSDINCLINHCPDGVKKVWWMRGLERWQMNEKNIVKYARKIKCITNALHLKLWLNSHNIKAAVCYSGLDIDFWKKAKFPKYLRYTTIGCLYNPRHATKRWKDFVNLSKILGHENYRYVGYGIKKPKEKICDIFITCPDRKRLRSLYAEADIWFCPTILEGFHQVAAEAALAGCLIVCSRCKHNGMGDYANDNTAERYDTINEAADKIRRPDYKKVKLMQFLLEKKIGGREKNMERMVKLLK